jgi:hypothetical protein
MKKGLSYSIASVVVLIICLIAFVLPSTLAGGQGGQQKLPAFGKYDGIEIKYEQDSDFANFVSYYGQMFQAQMGQMDSSTYYQVFNFAFNSTVTKLAYEVAVKDSGYVVPQTEINRELAKNFYDENGKYSSKLYKQTPAAQINLLKNEIEGNLISSRLYDDFFGSSTQVLGTKGLYGMKQSSKEVEFLADYNKNQSGFNLVAFPLSSYPEEEKVKFGKDNAAKFTKYDLSLVICADKSTADKVLTRLNNEEITFADAVAEYSEKAYSETDGRSTIPYQYQIEKALVNPEDLAKIVNLKKGEKSEVIETNAGFAIFLANEGSKQADFTDSEVITTVYNYMAAYENSVIENYFISKATDFTNACIASNFDDACAKLNVEKQVVTPFPLNYGNMEIAAPVNTTVMALTGADKNDNFLKSVFALKENELSKPLVLNNNVLVLQNTSKTVVEDSGINVENVVASLNSSSVQSTIMQSNKLENNFIEVYFNNFMN